MPSNEWKMEHPRATVEYLGLIPALLDEWPGPDQVPLRDWINAVYAHGGGFYDLTDQFVESPADVLRSKYPEDQDLRLIASTMIAEHTVRFYEAAMVEVTSPSGERTIFRMD